MVANPILPPNKHQRWPVPFCLQTSTKDGVFASLCIKWREEASQGFFQGTGGHAQCMDCSSDNGVALRLGGEAGGGGLRMGSPSSRAGCPSAPAVPTRPSGREALLQGRMGATRIFAG